jgi:hypothetical protein
MAQSPPFEIAKKRIEKGINFIDEGRIIMTNLRRLSK